MLRHHNASGWQDILGSVILTHLFFKKMEETLGRIKPSSQWVECPCNTVPQGTWYLEPNHPKPQKTFRKTFNWSSLAQILATKKQPAEFMSSHSTAHGRGGIPYEFAARWNCNFQGLCRALRRGSTKSLPSSKGSQRMWEFSRADKLW